MVVQFSITAANVDALIALGYTRIEVWSSIDQGNSYQEITGSAAAPAIVSSASAATYFRMGGKLLKLSVNGGPDQSILFSDLILYWTPTQVANRINEVIPGLASVSGSQVILTSPTTGRASTILVVLNEAQDLGMPTGTFLTGLNARPTLVSGTLIYTISDVAGHSDDRYKWRFSANGVNPVSEFSERIFGSTPALAGTAVSICTAQFVGLDGRPQKRRVVVVSDMSPASIGGNVVGNELPITVDSDDLGFLQFTLVRGARVRVAIEGTAFVREFVVPNSATFDLLTVMAAAPDPFSIQTTLPFLIRRSI